MIQVPATISGSINPSESQKSDVDLFRFQAKAGQKWIFEVKAARDKSPLDSKIAILDVSGDPVPRVHLQAVRDSYFTFRGKDSKQTGDFRLHNWQEMQLNQFLFASGEVVRFYHYPRGPDSGFNVYPNFGNRHTYFDTTSVTHALGEPCYIVEPRAVGSKILPNGLPVFTVNYENDDESTRRLGSDSKLHFTAPADGDYWLSIRDVRDFGGEAFKYSLMARMPKPDFKVRVTSTNPTIALGAGRRFGIEVERIDQFDGQIVVEIDGVPDGFSVTSPIVVEKGHLRAAGAIVASPDAKQPSKEDSEKVTVTARATINGREVIKKIGSLGEIKLGRAAKLITQFTPTNSSDPNVLEVFPGQTATVDLKVIRKGHDRRISYGNESALHNSPHGVYVDNIGLNGVLIPERQHERKVYITAEPWVQPTERWVFIESDATDRPTCLPILLRVMPSPAGSQTASN